VHPVVAATVRARLVVEEARHMPAVALSDALSRDLVARELNLALSKEEYTMKGPFMVVGLALIILGVVAFAYQGVTYTTREKVLEVGPITATKETKRTIPLPPVLGGIALAGGIVLLLVSARR
jgi:hypothetical protein